MALSIPKEYLLEAHSKSLFQLRLLHYPSVLNSELSWKKTRIFPHSDLGSLTLLFQDSVGGLEIESPPSSGNFISAKPIPRTVLVNVADIMERWSNGRWRSTIHRVVASSTNIDDNGMVKARYSIPFFVLANPDTIIEPLPGCWNEKNPKKYEPITQSQYLKKRMATVYS